MAARFLKAVSAGALAAGLVPAILIVVPAASGGSQSLDALQLCAVIGIVAVVPLILVATATLVLGVPAAMALRRLGMEGAPAYITIGALAGMGLIWAIYALVERSSSPLVLLALGGFGGVATAYVWWGLRPYGEDDGRVAIEIARLKVPHARPSPPQLWVQRWPPAAIPAGHIGIPPQSFWLALVVMGMAVTVAAAGEGRFDLQHYFPKSLWNTAQVACEYDGASRIEALSGIDDFEAGWYSTHLRAAQEPSLHLASQAAGSRDLRTYRFTWLRSFHPAVIVRVDELPGGAMRLTAKRLSGTGGYGPGAIDARVVRMLTPSETAKLNETLANGRVFDLPPRDCQLGVDGARWIMESSQRGSYRHVNRWTLERGPVHDLGILLLGFTGWRFERIY